MIDITNPKIREHEARLAEVGRLIRMKSGPAKWRAIHTFWLQLNPLNPRVAASTVKSVQELKSTRANKFASSNENRAGVVGGSGLRMGVRFPVAFLNTLRMFETEILTNADKNESKSELDKLIKTFPEYVVAEVW